MDAERRRREQIAKREGSLVNSQEVLAMEARLNLDVFGYLRRFVGEWCYVEGIKMNYRGVLKDVIPSSEGLCLIFHPLYRIGEWAREGPLPQYEMRMRSTEELPRMIQWSSVTDFGPMEANWPKT